jgi:DMSO reductase family type II enzyme chaperone
MTNEAKRRQGDPGSPVARGVTYELLARGLGYPTESALDGMRELAALALAVETEEPVHELARAMQAADAHALEQEYQSIFSVATAADCPQFESAYVCTDGGQQTTVMADVAGFYRAFGLEIGQNVRPDDITTELEFMGFLCRKEAYAAEHLGAPRVAQARRAQRMFLAEHPGRWAVALARSVLGKAEPGSFYALLGRTLEAWIERERRAIAVQRGGPAPVDVASPSWSGGSPQRAGSEGYR